ncbi:TIGR01777 family oxidoreductase [Psychrobacter aquaticus]|uniref:Cell division inhibitor n=1 Tax=Psychrobacter aquaticus CMS 56 TaxID=1354303 RepID=U4T6H4_9GAMM|nr:TIGR01777 family oxidoreductase [Psychrobacter aquaticus]ERL56515.1 Cell division inhibitor [Psychrobacter aquaticus CMS 56]
MNILISGGSGFLGSAFSRELMARSRVQNKNVNITWLTRDSSQAHPDDINMMTYEELAQSDMSFEVIVNLAGAGIADSRWSDERKEQLLASRIQPTEALLAFIARTTIKPKLLLSGSAIGWYGTQGDKSLTESSGFETDFAHKLCDDWEQLALKAMNHGVPVAIVRTGIVIHPEGGMLGKLLTPFKMGVGGQLGDGKQIMSWISREDWVGAAIFIIEQHLANHTSEGHHASEQHHTNVSSSDNVLETANDTPAVVYNLTAPNPVTNHTFTKALGTWLHRPTFFTLPEFLLKLMFGEMSTLLIDGQKVLPKALLEAGYEFKQPTFKQALTEQE